MKVRPLYLMICLVAALLLAAAGVALSRNVQAQAPPAGSQPAAKADTPAAIEPSTATASLPAGIDKALERALDKKLAPIMRMLAEMQEQKVRLTDVLGGIGYIIGLVGMAAYFKRKS